MSSTPLWLEDPYTPRAPLAGDSPCDVCVTGGGAGGLAAAWHFAQAGARVILLEAREIASGASGRNGGFFIAGAAPMYHETVARWGHERARAIHAATLRAQEEMLAVAEEIGAAQWFRRVGMLRLAVDAAEAEDVLAQHAALAADGFPGELVAADALPAALQRPERIGLFTPQDGAVHPVRWLRDLASELERRGVVIHERSRVIAAPEADSSGVRVRTEAGTVHAQRAVIAMDGGLAALVPGAGTVRARRLNMLATAPAAPVLPCPVYSRYGHEYAQQRDDGRVALGGYSDLDGDASWTDREDVSEPVQARLDRHLAEELRVNAPVTNRWVGIVGYSEDAMPRAGAVAGSDGRVLALGGYNGTGHVQAWVAAGAVVAGGSGPYAPLA